MLLACPCRDCCSTSASNESASSKPRAPSGKAPDQTASASADPRAGKRSPTPAAAPRFGYRRDNWVGPAIECDGIDFQIDSVAPPEFTRPMDTYRAHLNGSSARNQDYAVPVN